MFFLKKNQRGWRSSWRRFRARRCATLTFGRWTTPVCTPVSLYRDSCVLYEPCALIYMCIYTYTHTLYIYIYIYILYIHMCVYIYARSFIQVQVLQVQVRRKNSFSLPRANFYYGNQNGGHIEEKYFSSMCDPRLTYFIRVPYFCFCYQATARATRHWQGAMACSCRAAINGCASITARMLRCENSDKSA